jgi:poly-beta-hydroxyalkanoate depolymerase
MGIWSLSSICSPSISVKHHIPAHPCYWSNHPLQEDLVCSDTKITDADKARNKTHQEQFHDDASFYGESVEMVVQKHHYARGKILNVVKARRGGATSAVVLCCAHSSMSNPRWI